MVSGQLIALLRAAMFLAVKKLEAEAVPVDLLDLIFRLRFDFCNAHVFTISLIQFTGYFSYAMQVAVILFVFLSWKNR